MRRTGTTIKPSETDLEKYGTDLLALDGWRSLKTDPVSDTGFANRLRQWIMGVPALNHVRQLIFDGIRKCLWGKGFGERGMADRLYIRYETDWWTNPCCDDPLHKPSIKQLSRAEVLWIEWKRLGGKAAPHQREWIAAERARGALVLLASEDFEATPEGFLVWYRGSGLMRRKIC